VFLLQSLPPTRVMYSVYYKLSKFGLYQIITIRFQKRKSVLEHVAEETW